MGTGAPQTIPFPKTTFPGANPQESAGRLVNCYAEPLGDPRDGNTGAPMNGTVWRRMPGLTQFAMTAQTGYRGGIEAAGISYEVFDKAVTLDSSGNVTVLGTFPGLAPVSLAINQNETAPDVIAVDPASGAYVLNSVITDAHTLLVLAGTSNAGDTVAITFTNPAEAAPWPITVTTAALGAGGSAIAAATALVTVINGNATLSASHVSASNVGGTSATITVNQTGLIGNQTTLTGFTSTGGRITHTFNPTGGALSGGAGIAGTFTGTPTFYNGQSNLPQPNSVTFQDGYFFFTIADGRVYASGLNSLTQNALTFGRVLSKADVTLLRGIAYQGYLFLFTSGSCEVWNDQANPAPAFPYGRNAILAYGLIQGTAIAGFETGFDDLLWVAQDFGVYRLPQNSLTPTKVSNSDLDRAIAKQIRAGDTLQASVYIFSGKKVWVLSSSQWTWQFHLDIQQWFERSSLQSNGTQGRWRGTLGHQAFGKWLLGDQQSNAVLYLDETNFADTRVQDPVTLITTDTHMLMRIESGMVDKFPVRSRVARADFHFVRGVGTPVGQLVMTVLATAPGTGGVVQLTVNSTVGVNPGDQVQVSGITGTVEANGIWTVKIIDSQNLELQGSTFVHSYTGGGLALVTDIQGNIQNPTVAVSWSDDGGLSYRPPVLRNLGELSVVKTGRIAVKNAGLTGVIGRRWRLDISAPVYTAFLRGTQSDSPTIPN